MTLAECALTAFENQAIPTVPSLSGWHVAEPLTAEESVQALQV